METGRRCRGDRGALRGRLTPTPASPTSGAMAVSITSTETGAGDVRLDQTGVPLGANQCRTRRRRGGIRQSRDRGGRRLDHRCRLDADVKNPTAGPDRLG
jgi:hypothetical protein